MRFRNWLIRTLLVSAFPLVAQWASAVTITWDAGGDGTNWHDPLNWDTDSLPAPTDDVVIPIAFAGNSIHLDDADVVVTDLTSGADMSVTRDLTITGVAVVTGSLSLASNSTLIVDGPSASLSVSGVLDLAEANVSALNGASINFSGLTTLVRETRGTRNWIADGTGSQILLSGLSILTGQSYFSSSTHFQALNGGSIDLSSLTEVTEGPIWFNADGAGSSIDLSLLSSFNGYFWSTLSGFQTIHGGSLTVPQLTQIVDADLTWDGTGVFPHDQIISWVSGTFFVTGGGLSFDSLTTLASVSADFTTHLPAFPLLANIDDSDFRVSNGLKLDLPLVTSYTNSNRSSRHFIADGIGSELSLPNLTTLTGHSYFKINFDIQAINGGLVALDNLTEVVDGAVWFEASGTSSFVDLPLLSSFNGYFWDTRSGFGVSDNGEINCPSLVSAQEADFSYLDGTMDIAQIESWSIGTLNLSSPGSRSFSNLHTMSDVTAVFDAEVPAFPALGNIDGSNFTVQNGAVLSLPLVTAIINDSRSNATLIADGIGSEISLPNLTTLTGHSYFRINFDIQAINGGLVALDSLTEVVDGAVWFEASGADSLVDLPLLSSFNGYFWDTRSGFGVSDNGEINCPSLVSAHEADFSYLDGTMDIAQIESWSIGTLNISSPGSRSFSNLHTMSDVTAVFDAEVPAFPALGNIDGPNFTVQNGAVLSLPLVTAIINDSRSDASLIADGIGSQISLPNLATLTGHKYIDTNFDIQAINGGLISFGTLTEVTDGAVWFEATGTDSVVDLPSLSSFNGYFWNTRSGFNSTGGGEVNIQSLTQLTEVDLTLSDTGAIDLDQIVSWNGGTLDTAGVNISFPNLTSLINVNVIINGNTVTFPALTNLDASSLSVSGGSQLSLDQVISFNKTSNGDDTLRASGSGSRIAFPVLKSLSGSSANSADYFIEAIDGGQVSFPELSEVTGGAVTFKSEGLGSLLELPRLGTFTGNFNNTTSGYIATSDGTLELATELNGTSATSATITVNDTALFSSPTISVAANSILQGNGTFPTDIIISEGTVNPGTSAGSLTIEGDLVVEAEGTLAIEIGGTVQGTEYDLLTVTGSLTLEGTLATTLINDFGPTVGDVFTVAIWETRLGAFSDFTGLDAGANTEFVPAFVENSLQLTATFSTGPSIIETFPDGFAGSILDEVLVTFSEPIENGSVQKTDAVLEGPSGLVEIDRVFRVSPTTYRFTFPPQYDEGIYQFVFGPEINDIAGNPMNQDGDATNGELVEDAYAAAIEVSDAALADLEAVNVSAPTEAVAGQTTTISWTTRNNRENPTPSIWRDAIWLSPNPDGSDGQRILEVTTTAVLEGNAELPRSIGLIIPANLAGTRYLVIRTDSQDDVSELGGELNNETVMATPILVRAPDLNIATASITSSTATWNDTLGVDWETHNIGTAAAEGSWIDRVYLAPTGQTNNIATLLDLSAPTNSLAATDFYPASQTITIPANGTIPAGTYDVRITTDRNNQLPESDNGNNSILAGTLTITLPPLPDLAVTNVSIPANAQSGGPFEAMWTVQNNGAASVANWSMTVLLSDNSTHGRDRILSVVFDNDFIPAGGQTQITRSLTVPPDSFNGDLWLIVSVDNENAIPEESENNNTGTSASSMNVPARLTLLSNSGSTSIPEDAPNNRHSLIISRNGSTATPLTVNLENPDPTELTLPSSVVIPVGQSSVVVAIDPVDDDSFDGPQSVNITASASGFPNADLVLTIIDTDQPELTLALSEPSVLEGETITGTVTLPFIAESAVTVDLLASDPTELVIPSSILISAGTQSFTFSVTARQNGIPQIDQIVTITARSAGFVDTADNVTIVDEDIDSLSLQVSASTISERDGRDATLLTVERLPVTSGTIRVFLTPSVEGLLEVPDSVIISAGETSTTVGLSPIDNDQVEGPKNVSITASVLDPDSRDALATSSPVNLTIHDDDGPSLSLELSNTLAAENLPNAATLTIRSNVLSPNPLTIQLASSDQGEATLPASVVLPANQSSTSVTVATMDDAETDGTQAVLFTASATGFNAGSIQLNVTDDDLPDLVLQNVAVDATAYSESLFELTYTLVNQGSTDAVISSQQVFLSDDPHPGDDVFLGTISLGSGVAAGESFTRTVSYFAPRTAGEYWIIVIADATDLVEESIETNNTGVSPSSMEVTGAYSATVQAGLDSGLAGDPVPLSGSATMRANGAPAANKIVSIHLWVQGTERLFAVLTDSTGQFTTTFYPLPSEGGQYEIGAAHPGESTAPVQDSFQLIGLKADPQSPTIELIADDAPVHVTVDISNLADIQLLGTQINIPTLPTGLTLDVALGSLDSPVTSFAPSEELPLIIEASATNDVPEQVDVTLEITTSEGVRLPIPVTLSTTRRTPQLSVEPPDLYAAIMAGEPTVVTFDLTNQGGAPTGPIALSLPASLPWIQSIAGTDVPSINPGDTATIALQLLPPEDLALGEYFGRIGINASEDQTTVGFRFLNVSEATGDVVVYVEDELTYYAEGSPLVSGAEVLLRDYFSGEIVAEAITPEEGFVTFTNVTEGYYELTVREESHRTHRETILVQAGRLNSLTAFLNYISITYNWTVVPTTIEDRYRIVVETVFETNLPIPVVTVDPAFVDLDELTEPVTQIDFTLTNQGLLAAENTRFSFSPPAGWEIDPLIEDIGTMPAKSSLVIPVIFKRPNGTLAPQAGNCGGGAVNWTVQCGGGSQGGASSVGLGGGGGGGCGGGGGGVRPFGGGGGGGAISASGGGDCASGDDDPCVPKAILLCGVGLIPIPGACLPGVLDCGLSYDSSKPSTSTLGCILALAGCIPGLNVPANLLLCSASIALCYSGEGEPQTMGTIAGGDAISSLFVQSTPIAQNPNLDSLLRYIQLAESIYDYHLIVFGSDVWFNGLLGPDYQDWISRLNDAILESSDEGAALSVNEIAGLLADPLPEGLTASQVNVLIERFQNTATYDAMGIDSLESLPEGMDPNFIPFEDLQIQALLAEAAWDEAIEDGFQDPFEGLIHYRDRLIASAGTPSFGVVGTSSSNPALAPQAGGGVCARVRLRIEQEAVLARDAFDARLEIINETDLPIDRIEVNLSVSTLDGEDATDLFQIRSPKLTDISAVDGTGLLLPADSGIVQWIIVPTSEAAPVAETTYAVSGFLSYIYDDVVVNIPLEPVNIDVLPTPRLQVRYFHQRDVFSDDPFTDVVEPSIPYSLGVMVENVGAGLARDFSITSAQPEIVDNEKGLLIDFQIIATEVDGQPLSPGLTADFGDIGPGTLSVGRWLLTSSLQGLFIEYEATFEHVDSFGDPRLSLIESVEIHEMIQAVDGGDDTVMDFLTNDIPDEEDLPDTLYRSSGDIFRINVVQEATPDRAPSDLDRTVELTTTFGPGWTYLRVADPAEGDWLLAKVTRENGTELPSQNFWQTDRTFIGQGQKPLREDTLHLLDLDGGGTYTLHYIPLPQADTIAPTSSVAVLPEESPALFPVEWSGDDDNAVLDYSIFVSKDGGPFLPWLQQTSTSKSLYSGEFGSTYAFYSIARDASGNTEEAPGSPDASTLVNIQNAPPVLDPVVTQTVNENEEFSLFVNAIDPDVGDSLTFRLIQGPTGMVVQPSTGQVTWTTGETHGGSTQSITVEVSDNGLPNAADTVSFNLNVIETNSPPEVDETSLETIPAGQTLMRMLSASDFDTPAQTLTFSLGSGAPLGFLINPTSGLVTWTPSLAQVGNHDIPINVSDGSDTTHVILPVLVTMPPNYHRWKERFWPSVSALDVIGFDQDPDEDGVRNIEEYAYGMRPDLPLLDQMPIVQRVVEGAKFLTMTFARPLGNNDFEYILEASTSLDNSTPWEPVSPHVVTTTDRENPEIELVSFRDTQSLGGENPRFVRLRVEDRAGTYSSGDANRNNIDDLLEAAFGVQLPGNTIPRAFPRVDSVIVDGIAHLRVSFVRRIDDPDLSVEVLGASDLNAPEEEWELLSTVVSRTENGLPVGMERVTIRDDVDSAASATRFIRVRVRMN